MKLNILNTSISQILQLLISGKKKIGFLFGAGTSINIPSSSGMKGVGGISAITNEVMSAFDSRPTTDYKDALNEIKSEIENANTQFNVESLLTQIELKKLAAGSYKLNGLDAGQFKDLIGNIHEVVRKRVSVHEGTDKNNWTKIPHYKFAQWISAAERTSGIEIFTTNYDYLFEIGLETASVPFFDGFCGSYRPFFASEKVADFSFLPKTTKLWKIHGSLGWKEEDTTVVRLSGDIGSKDLLIYPSSVKYSLAKKMPFIALIDRLYGFVRQSDSVLITCGYSFHDEHINERLLAGLRSNPDSVAYGLVYFDSEPDDGDPHLKNLSSLCPRILLLSTHGIYHDGAYEKWEQGEEKECSFDDFGSMASGSCECTICDFATLVSFLKKYGWVGD